MEVVAPEHYFFATVSLAAAGPRHQIGDPSYPRSRSLGLMLKTTLQQLEKFEGKGRFCIESAMASSVTGIPILKSRGKSKLDGRSWP